MNSQFTPLYTSKKRYFFLSGGRGSLKSSNVHEWAAISLTDAVPPGILFTRYTMTSAKKSIIPEFEIVLDRLHEQGIIDANNYAITQNKVTYKPTGGFIIFSGIKTSSGLQTANLKSIAGITDWIIEEGEDFNDEKSFEAIDDSIRTTHKQNRVIVIMNPTTKEHFFHNKWIKKKNRKINVEGFEVTVSDLPEVEHIHTSYHIAERAGYLDKSWLAKAKKHYNEALAEVKQTMSTWTGTKIELQNEVKRIWHTSHYYYNYIGGWLEKAEGVIFDTWEEGIFDDTLPYAFGLDYGYSPDPLGVVKVAVDSRRKIIYLEERAYDTEVDDVPALLEARNIKKTDAIIADTNENRTTAKTKKSGYNIRRTQKNRIVDDIREMKKYRVVICGESPNMKTEANNYAWNDKKASIPIDAFNHLWDGARYAFNFLTKKRKGVKRAN